MENKVIFVLKYCNKVSEVEMNRALIGQFHPPFFRNIRTINLQYSLEQDLI